MYGTTLVIYILLGAGSCCLLAGCSSDGATKTPAWSVCFPVSLLIIGFVGSAAGAAAGGTVGFPLSLLLLFAGSSAGAVKRPAWSFGFLVNLLFTGCEGGGGGAGLGGSINCITSFWLSLCSWQLDNFNFRFWIIW
jgi:hypothetical protein